MTAAWPTSGVGDVAEPDSDAWWIHRLVGELVERRKRITPLWERYQGDPPLPELGNPTATATRARVWKAFQRKARLNLAELIVTSIMERLTPIGARVEADDEGAPPPAGGDDPRNATARRIWRGNHMDVQSGDLIEKMLVMGVAYTLTGPPDEPRPGSTDRPLPVITVEDPRYVITAQDPARPYRDIAGIKLYNDPIRGVDVLVLHRPGRSVRMEREQAVTGSKARTSALASDRFRFEPGQWSVVEHVDLTRFGVPADRLAISRFSNHGEIGEFEGEIDHLDRVDHMILQRIIVATLQAFKQRAIKGVPTVDPRTGEPIDYSDIFTADPGALWLLPATAELWESGQVDLTPLLSAVKDDVRDLAAVLRLPVYHFMPDAASGSAEGASAAREGLVYRAEDRVTRLDDGFADTVSLAFCYLPGDEGDDPLTITTLWAPIERFSLAERYDAASKAAGIVPWESIMVDILQYPPDALPRLRAQRAEDALLAPATAADGPGRSAFTSGTGDRPPADPTSAGQTGGSRTPRTTGGPASNGAAPTSGSRSP